MGEQLPTTFSVYLYSDKKYTVQKVCPKKYVHVHMNAAEVKESRTVELNITKINAYFRKNL